MSANRKNLGLSIVLLAASMACTSVDRDAVSIHVSPARVALEPESTAVFTASVEGTTNLGVVWTASCGTIAGSGAAGTYTAPDQLGDCVVTAASRANRQRTASADVDVVLHPRQVWAWQYVAPGTAEAFAAAVDPAGHVVVAGLSGGSVFGDAAGGADAVVVKFGADGQVLWSRQFGTSGRDAAYAVSVDADGRILVAGATEGSLFGERGGQSDAFLLTLAPDGEQLWARQFGTSSADVAFAVQADPEGRAWVAGFTHGALYEPVRGSVDGFVAVFDIDGESVWGLQLDGAGGMDYALALAMDGDQALVAGYTDGVIGDENAGKFDAFLVRLDAHGDRVWARQFGSSEWEAAQAVAVDGAGRAWVGGYTLGRMAGPEHLSYDAFLTGFDRAGQRLWTRQPSSSAGDSYDNAHGVAVDGAGRVILVGASGGDLIRPSHGAWDAFALAFDPDGAVAWSFKAGTQGWDAFRAVAAYPNGDLALVGSLDGTTYGQGVVEQDLLVARVRP
jgi:hypothetical protein